MDWGQRHGNARRCHRKNIITGAGAVVTKDVSAISIVACVPARAVENSNTTFPLSGFRIAVKSDRAKFAALVQELNSVAGFGESAYFTD